RLQRGLPRSARGDLLRRGRRRPDLLEASGKHPAVGGGHREPPGSPVRVAVLGGGAWGTALAAHVRRAGHQARLWLREESTARGIRERQENAVYLPGVRLPADLGATTELAEATAGAEMVLMVVPSEFCRGVYRRLRPLLSPETLVVSATKG